jgi:thiosulfate dehydrogenase
MEKRGLPFTLVITLSVVVVGAGLSLIFAHSIRLTEAEQQKVSSETEVAPARLDASRGGGDLLYNPPRPEEAPPDIRETVMLGYHLMMETPKYAGRYVGDKLSCTSCHFNGGVSEGGKNGGLSLVGVATQYPAYQQRSKADVDLAARTNNCFERSMNGKPLPATSKEMLALLTYYQWISRGLPIYAEVPWLGLKPVPSKHQPDRSRGEQVFQRSCTPCHGTGGQGTQLGPPLWGDHSFNDAAGMSRLADFAGFTYWNMPRGNPTLTAEEALDVAAFVTSQPRAHFVAP